MALLHNTQLTLAELSANRQQDFGMHGALQVKTGVPGLDIGELPYDAARHAVTAINPLSVWESVTGIPHVRQVIPHQPLEMSVIVQHEAGHDNPDTANLKQRLASQILAAMRDSMPGMTDSPYAYHVGDVDDDLLDVGTELISTDGNEEKAANIIADICRGGLAYVISDFNHLPLGSRNRGDFPGTIGIKVNHTAEMPLPANIGYVSLGGRSEVNTDNPSQLHRYNSALESIHKDIIDRLEHIGIAVAQVVFDPKRSVVDGLNIAEADAAIARATTRATQL